MAILQGSPGLKAQVIVNEEPLREYRDNSIPPTASKVSKYIESVSDAKFALRILFKEAFPSDQDVAIKISLDGNVIQYVRIAAGHLHHPGGFLLDGPIVKFRKATYSQEFKFKTVESIAEHRPVSTELENKVARTGTITLELQHCKNVRKDSLQSCRAQHPASLRDVPESAMKDDPKSHQAGLTQPKPRKAIDLEDWDWVGDGPFATFNFHYRSLEFLQAMWIAPRPGDSSGHTEENLAHAPALSIVRNNKKRKARGRQSDRSRQDLIIEIDDDSDIGIVSSQPVRKRRLGRIGATQEEAIDVDEVSEDEGAEAIKKMVAGKKRRGVGGRFVRN